MPRLPLPVGACLALASCATGPAPAPTAPTATEPPPVPAEAPTRATLSPAADVVELQLTCREREVDNGVDDDCDGHIDEGVGGTPAALELSLTWNGPARVMLEAAPLGPARGADGCAPDTACMVRLSSDAPLREPLELRVSRDDGPDAPATLTASLCAAAHGTWLGCHNFTLERDQDRQVARLSVP